jgi:BASS family bile acid:Na+ symporter
VSAAQIFGLLVNFSMSLSALSLGLRTPWSDAVRVLRDRDLLIRSLLSVSGLMPVFAALLVMLFDLTAPAKATVVAIALSPLPAFLPGSRSREHGVDCYLVALAIWAAILSIVVVPLGMLLVEAMFNVGRPGQMLEVLAVIVVSLLLPLWLGMLLHQRLPRLAARYGELSGRVGTMLLVFSAIPILITTLPMLKRMSGDGTLVVLVAFSLAGLLIGHTLGGPDAGDRGVLALATASRHPGVALSVAVATFPSIDAAAAVVVWHLIVSSIVALPYARWRQREHALGRIVGN